jgi:biopolymer transport protein ExbD
MHVGDGGDSGDVELNLAPIIDCMTVLVAFLLLSASYVSVFVLDANLPPLVVASESVTAPPKGITLSIKVKEPGTVELKSTGEENLVETLKLDPGDGAAAEALRARINELKARWPETQSLTLSGEDEVPYHEVVRVLEEVRPAMANISLGGF